MKIFLIPDAQVRPGCETEHLYYAGRYAAEKKPDVIVCIGDFADMSSLSSYDKGKKCFEGRSYIADIEAAKAAMSLFLQPIREEEERLVKNKWKQWHPRLVMTLGNHEERILRAVNEDRKLDGLVKIEDLEYKKSGWEVHPFLEPVEIGGVMFCHYFTSGIMGRPVTSAAALISKKHQSCIAGHQQGRQVAYGTRGDGQMMTSMILGSFYTHEEEYLGPQGNKHWRGCAMLNEVENGSFDEMFVSVKFLKQKYGNY